MVGWETEITTIFTNSDFGFLGNLIPLVLALGVTWGLSRKPREMLFIQFPVLLALKFIFPFIHPAILIISFAGFIMNLIGSKGDMLADVKEMPQKTKEFLVEKKHKAEYGTDYLRLKARESLRTAKEKDIIKKIIKGG